MVRATTQFLKENKNLIIGKSDKGNSTVVTTETEYIEAMTDMFKDERTYKLLKSDPTQSYERKANDLITSLEKKDILCNKKAKQLRRYNSVCPKGYGLRKTHKPNVIAYRPVISNIDSPTYNLSKYLHSILTPICSTFNRNIRNSKELVTQIRSVILPHNHILVSLDVVSLFPSIPKSLVIEIVKKKWKYIECYTEVSKEVLIDIIQFIFNSSFFKFNGSFYSQLDGTAMGNPASPSLANLVMEFVINEVLEQLEFDVSFGFYYVDDSIWGIPSENVNEFCSKFNSFHPNLKFTYEIEE